MSIIASHGSFSKEANLVWKSIDMVPYQDSEARKSNVLEEYNSLAYASREEICKDFPHICSHAVENRS